MSWRSDPGSLGGAGDKLAFDVEQFGWEDAAETVPGYRLRCRACGAVFETRSSDRVLRGHLRTHTRGLRRTGIASACVMLAALLGGCAAQPQRYVMRYPGYARPSYFMPAQRYAVVLPRYPQAVPSPAPHGTGWPWARDAAIGGGAAALAVGGTEIARRALSRQAGAAAAGSVETAAAGEAIAATEARAATVAADTVMDRIMVLILEDWWLAL